MKIHHLNCMTFYQREKEITHCLLVETNDGLALVDTGLGTADYKQPTWRVQTLMTIDRVPRDIRETAIEQVRRLGYDPREVRHIMLTHLHSDHSGGLPDFPTAKIHVYAKEYRAAMHPRRSNFLDLIALEPAHWAHGPDWAIHEETTVPWLGLECIPVLGNEHNGILLVPLEGHTPGHCGVAVFTGDHWLLHCGDSFVRAAHVDPINPKSPFPTWYKPIERVMFPALARERVRSLLRDHAGEVQVICSHDPHVFAECLAANS